MKKERAVSEANIAPFDLLISSMPGIGLMTVAGCHIIDSRRDSIVVNPSLLPAAEQRRPSLAGLEHIRGAIELGVKGI